MLVASVAAVEKAFVPRAAVASGVVLARDLVNEPANVLYPEEFARRTGNLKKLGVVVDVLDVKEMKKLGMNALLGVGQGSGTRAARSSCAGTAASGGDAGRLHRQRGLLHRRRLDQAGCRHGGHEGRHGRRRLRRRPHACARGTQGEGQRRGRHWNRGEHGRRQGSAAGRHRDHVGQTIEIINTDAEGRLVLSDVLHYVNKHFKPKFMIDLATLTGAIIVALGQEYAGLFANDDKLAERLVKVGNEVGERVWRMPLGPSTTR